MRQIYLDHAATTPLDPVVLEAMLPYLREEFGNASSVHRLGQRARGAIDEARARVASLIGARDSEIVFTGSGTEANNMAIVGVLRAAAGRDGGPNRTDLVTSTIEHPAVLNTARHLDRTRHGVHLVRAGEDGRVDLTDLEAAMTDRTCLVSIMLANNETGVVQPMEEVVRLARAKGALVHTDAVQALGKLKIAAIHLDVDLLTISAHKIFGPKGVGALFIRSGADMTALVRGGSQERNRRAGTENVAGIVGFGKAAELAQQRRREDSEHLQALRDRLEEGLLEKGLGQVRRNGVNPRIGSTTSLSFEGVSGEDLLITLDLVGIAVSTGAACAAGSPEPSHVLKAMGFPRERVNSTLRFSVGRTNTAEEIDHTIAVVTAAAARLRRSARWPASP